MFNLTGILELSRETEPIGRRTERERKRGWGEREKDLIYHEELAHAILEAAKFEIYRQPPRDFDGVFPA